MPHHQYSSSNMNMNNYMNLPGMEMNNTNNQNNMSSLNNLNNMNALNNMNMGNLPQNMMNSNS